jgi:hypothetical protein
MPLRFKIGNLPPTGHEREGTSDLAGVDVTLKMVANALKALRRETDFFWFYKHNASCWSNINPA